MPAVSICAVPVSTIVANAPGTCVLSVGSWVLTAVAPITRAGARAVDAERPGDQNEHLPGVLQRDAGGAEDRRAGRGRDRGVHAADVARAGPGIAFGSGSARQPLSAG